MCAHTHGLSARAHLLADVQELRDVFVAQCPKRCDLAQRVQRQHARLVQVHLLQRKQAAGCPIPRFVHLWVGIALLITRGAQVTTCSRARRSE